MKILVTGGSGFIGHNLLLRLKAEGHELVCFDRYEAPFLSEIGVCFVCGDMSDVSALRAAVKGVDAIVHLACTVIPKSSNEDPSFDVISNVGGTIRLLDLAVSEGVGRFVFISSGGVVYGVPSIVPIPETHVTNPICSYGITKLTIEKYLCLYARERGLRTCSLRLANPYGEYQNVKNAQGAVTVFCYKALLDQKIDIWGDGRVERDFLYIKDAVDAIVCAIDNQQAEGEINIGSGRSVSLNSLLEVIETVLGRPVRRNYLPGRSFDVPVNVLDVSKAKAVLGWGPRTDLAEGVGRTLDWIRKVYLR